GPITLPPTIASDLLDASNQAIVSAPIGDSVHVRATVGGSQGTPTGTVTFRRFGNTTCTGTLLDAETVGVVNGVAESSAALLPPMGVSYQAHYNSAGDPNYVDADGL